MEELIGQIEIRESRAADAAPRLAYELRNRQFLQPFTPVPLVGESWWTLPHARGLAARTEGRIPFVAVLEGEVIGQATLNNISRGAFQSGNVGYSVDERFAGRGIATMIVARVIEHAFSEAALHRIEAGTLVENVASQRVLEKSGFTKIGLAPRYLQIAGTWQDHVLYQLTAEERVPPPPAPRPAGLAPPSPSSPSSPSSLRS